MKFRRSIFKLFIAAAFILTQGSIASAQQLNNEKSVGIQVSPILEDFKINRSETALKSITVNSLTKQTVTYYPTALNFEADQQTGKPVFLNIDESFSRYSLANWVSFDQKSFVLLPGEEKTVNYTVTAPDDASPGGHYAAILLSTEEPEFDEKGNFVGVVGLIGTLALAVVPGNIVESLEMTSFTSPMFLFKPPADFQLTIANSGNIHLRPEGGITIRNWLGKQTAYLPINESNGAVLPESQRQFVARWGFPWTAVGKYSANLNIAYGDDKNIFDLRTFYVVPYWLLTAIAAIIILWIRSAVIKKRVKRNRQTPKRRVVMG